MRKYILLIIGVFICISIQSQNTSIDGVLGIQFGTSKMNVIKTLNKSKTQGKPINFYDSFQSITIDKILFDEYLFDKAILSFDKEEFYMASFKKGFDIRSDAVFSCRNIRIMLDERFGENISLPDYSDFRRAWQDVNGNIIILDLDIIDNKSYIYLTYKYNQHFERGDKYDILNF